MRGRLKNSLLSRRLFSKSANWENCSSISDCTAGKYEDYDICNKNALFAWKCQVIFDPVF